MDTNLVFVYVYIVIIIDAGRQVANYKFPTLGSIWL